MGNKLPIYNIDTYPPDLRPFVDAILVREMLLTDHLGFDLVPLRKTLTAIATESRDAVRQLPEVKALVDLVRSHEWVTDEDGIQFCPFCLRLKEFGHSNACGFIAALAPFEEASDGA